MEQLKFTIPEIFSLIGVIQCIYILVYMMFRAGNLSRAGIPFLYFLVLGTAFFVDFAWRFINEISPYYDMWSLSLWLAGAPIGVLVVLQVAQISKIPDFKNFWLILMPFVPFLGAYIVAPIMDGCSDLYLCESHLKWLVIFGLLAGGLSLLSVWFHKNMLSDLLRQKFSKERYWVILAIIISNVILLILMLSNLQSETFDTNYQLSRTIIGLAFIYLVTTSLFRIYPQSLISGYRDKNDTLNKDEMAIASKIETLLKLDKVYQETSYTRSDLAREVEASEMIVSRVINKHFEKSLPQLLNEYRVEDAKRLLKETDANISIIAKEVGFNSMASFNRVFRDFTGLSPSKYRSS